MHRFLIGLLALALLQPLLPMEKLSPTLESEDEQKSLNEAMWRALRENNIKRIKELIHASPEVTTLTQDESLHVTPCPPLQTSNSRNKPLCSLLTNSRASILTRNENGVSPLQFAARMNNLELLRLFVEHAPDCRTKEEDLNAGLSYAAYAGYKEVCEYLLEHGANPDATSEGENAPPIILTAQSGHTDILQLLLHHGANVNARTEFFCSTALIEASFYGHVAICRLLLNHGADLFATSPNGKNALIWAAKEKKVEVCQLLVDHLREMKKCVRALLYSLKQHEHESGRMLYRLSKDLLRPHLEKYNLRSLLNTKNRYGKRAFDYLPVDCLNPDKKTITHN